MKKDSFHIYLSENWKTQSSIRLSESGSVISTLQHEIDNWIPAKVPSTVLGTLVAAEIIKNPYFGENLKTIPTEKFEVPWWYTTVFDLDAVREETFAALNFDGINYKANVWLNGNQIADTTSINGAYRRTSVDISEHIVAGENMLAVEV